MTIKNLPAEERPREKLFLQGAKSLSNTELLAVLLRTGTNKCSALTLAERLMTFDDRGLSFLCECLPEELLKIDGIGQAKACQIVAAIELGKRISAKKPEKKVMAGNAEFIAQLFMEELRHQKKEFFYVVILNTKGEIITTENVAIGDLSSTIIHPREVFSPAIKRGAASVVFVHNHPSGNPKPSLPDLEITDRLVEAGKILGITVLDHIVIGDGKFASFRAKNLI